MGTITILDQTTKNPITLVGQCAAVCVNADTSDNEKNYKRGIDCLESGHGRTFEFPDVYMTISGYSARVMREWYTHIGGLPTRLQESTRYVNYKEFGYIIPKSIANNEEACDIYKTHMLNTSHVLELLENIGIPREDSALVLPFGMETVVTCKHNLRNLIDMSRQRECKKAYWEYRDVFRDLKLALANYSDEWAYITNKYMHPKCDEYRYCTEKKGCGRWPKKNG